MQKSNNPLFHPIKIPEPEPSVYKAKRKLRAWAREANRFEKQEKEIKYGLLFKHYGIDPKDKRAWEHLAKILATELFPGFSIKKVNPKKGRKHKWNSVVRALLWFDIEEIKIENPDLIDEQACNKLLQTSHWINFVNLRRNKNIQYEPRVDTFLRQYHRTKHNEYVQGYIKSTKGRGISKMSKKAIFEQYHASLAILVTDTKIMDHPKAAVI